MSLEIGHAVLVPFGKQKVSGYVIEFLEETHLTTVRSISRILDPTPAFDRESIPFFKWIANYYLSGLGEVIATALPQETTKGKSMLRCIQQQKLVSPHWPKTLFEVPIKLLYFER